MSQMHSEALLGALNLGRRIRHVGFLLCGVFALGFGLLLMASLRGPQHEPLLYVIDASGRALPTALTRGPQPPSRIEALHVAKQFVQLFVSWNSSTVHTDTAALINLCTPALAKQMRQDLAEVGFIEAIRKKEIRSETYVHSSEIEAEGPGFFRVHLKGEVHIHSLTHYDRSSPQETRNFDVRVTLIPVPRDPSLHPNGLAVAQLNRGDA